MLAGLAAAGYTPEQVTIVALSHLHRDHIGGLMEGGGPTFPNARYVVNQVEYDFWVSAERVGTAAEENHKMVYRCRAAFAKDDLPQRRSRGRAWHDSDFRRGTLTRSYGFPH